MRRALWWTCALVVACGGKAVIDPGSGSGGTGGTTSSSSTSTSSTSSSSTSTSGSSTSSSSSGQPNCNGAPCPPTSYCDWGDNLCGLGGPGECEVIPDLCSEEEILSCGCDGQIYPNPCFAAVQGIDISNAEICTPPLNMVPCGWTFCAHGTSYCQVVISDIGGWPDEYVCHDLPPGCSGSGASCSCMTNEPCGDWCEQDPDGSITLTCPGG